MTRKKIRSRLAASAARTATGQSGSTSLGYAADDLILFLDITAVSGATPSMTVDYQVSPDDGTTWYTIASFAAKTATGRDVLRVTSPIGELARLNWTISGTTPSFTFSIDAEFAVKGV